MRTIYLALDYKCNHNCMICPLSTFDKLHKPLTMEDVKNAIETNHLGDGDRVVLSGGEPCLSELFFDTVKYIMDHGLGITMLSNVSCFSDVEFLRRFEMIVDKSRFDIITALHCSCPDLHDEITGCCGSHAMSLTAIGNLIQHNFHVTIKHIVSNKTYKVNKKLPCVNIVYIYYIIKVGKSKYYLLKWEKSHKGEIYEKNPLTRGTRHGIME